MDKMLETLGDNLNINTISKYLHDVTDLKGIYITPNKEIKEYYISARDCNKYLLTRLIAIMLKNKELKISYTDKTSKKNKDYLEKLIKE